MLRMETLLRLMIMLLVINGFKKRVPKWHSNLNKLCHFGTYMRLLKVFKKTTIYIYKYGT